jgi:hypothetical protein
MQQWVAPAKEHLDLVLQETSGRHAQDVRS